MFKIGRGGLRLSKRGIWDGSIWYNTTSLYLSRKAWFSKKRDNCAAGEWLAIGNLILSFTKINRAKI